MNKTLYSILLIFLFTPAPLLYAPESHTVAVGEPKPINPYQPLIEAISLVESSLNPFAINKDEQAYGLLQIRQCKLDDFNKANGTDLILTDMFNALLSARVFMWHCLKYDNHNFETIAKSWNGSGPKTEVYWEKVKEQLHNRLNPQK